MSAVSPAVEFLADIGRRFPDAASRATRAIEICTAGRATQITGTDVFVLADAEGSPAYTVARTFRGWHCTCPDFCFNSVPVVRAQRVCKHILAARALLIP